MGLGSWFRKIRADKAEQKAIKLEQKALKQDMKADYLNAVNDMNDEKAKQILKENGLIKKDDTLVPVGPLQTGYDGSGMMGFVRNEPTPAVLTSIKSPQEVEDKIKETGAKLWMAFGGLGSVILVLWILFRKRR